MRYTPFAIAVTIIGLATVALLASHSRFSAQTYEQYGIESSSSSSFVEPVLPITDVDWRSEEGAAVFFFLKERVIHGFPDMTFRGSEFISRAEIAKILLLSGRIPITHIANNGRFHDVAEDAWYTPYVATAAVRGIIIGYPTQRTLFQPFATVNTAEFLKMLTLTFDLHKNMRHGFRDIPPLAWYAPYAGVAWQYKLFDRVEHLQAARSLSRRDVILALFRLFTVKRPRGVSEWFAPNIPGHPTDTIPMHEPVVHRCPPLPLCISLDPNCRYVVELDEYDCFRSCGELKCMSSSMSTML